MLGWTSHPFLEEMALLFTALAHCELNHLGEFFTRLVRRGNKKIHAKRYCVGDERSKRGNRSKGPVQVKEEVMP